MGTIFSCCEKNYNKKKKKVATREDKRIIYSFSREGLKKDIDLIGQDSVDIIDKELGEGTKYFAVYDGHGTKGKMASNLVKEELRKLLIKEKDELIKFADRKSAEAFFKSIFNSVQKKFQKNIDLYELSGSCVISILIHENNCYVINLGDSRAVMGAKQGLQRIAYQLSVDHKPCREDEKKRIDLHGGIVSITKNGNSNIPRIYSLNEDGPGLAVSRTLGDIVGHSVGVSYEPEVALKEIENQDKFIVIASDGVWDVMNSSEVVGFIFEKENSAKEKIAEELVNECRTRWEKINDYKRRVSELRLKDNKKHSNIDSNLSIDDISCIICFFGN